MRELSLFSEAGGGLLGWQHCGYVEFDNYCQQIIAARIKDGYLESAPIFGDIRAFIDNGYADAYQGLVDVITAGFPCQPFSLAGKQAGEDDPRNMWPQTIDVIRRVRPKFALLENVPNLLANQYARTIFQDFAESGYQCRWRILSAAEMGAPHRRDRLWIVAYSQSKQGDGSEPEIRINCEQPHRRDRLWIVAYSQSKQGDGSEPEIRINCEQPQCKFRNGYKQSGFANNFGDRERWEAETEKPVESNQSNAGMEQERGANFYTNHRCQRGKRSSEEKVSREQALPWGKILRGFEDIERRSDIPSPLVCGMDDGLAHRLDRTKALGNGQVPIVAAVAWLLLTEELDCE